ncbi:YkvA family protein [Clostridium paraputrificum]|uniref:YkvA family protein n=1 Tax=Clostridium paraputrificum TaxID=29363 RepID=UPI003D3318DB
MKISGVQAQLTGEDILSIINEFVDVEGLELKEVTIDNEISVKGTFKKGVSIDFEGNIALDGVQEGKVYGKFSKLKVMKLGVFRPIRSFALKMGLKQLTIKGIEADKDKIIIELDKIINPIPFVDLKIKEAYIKGQALQVEVEEVNISIKGGLMKEEPEVEEITEEEEILMLPTKKVEDGYTIGRKAVENKMSPGVKKVSDYLFVVPDVVALIYRLLKDSRVPLKTKLSISASLAYILFPTDIIPNNIPFIGRIDDLAVVFFALNRIASDVSTTVILENWAGKNEIILVLQSGLDYITNFTGAKNVEKLYNIVEELSTL